METKEKQYKWKIVAWSALKNSENKTWTIQESQWFDKKQACINDFKENMKTVMMLQAAGDLKYT